VLNSKSQHCSRKSSVESEKATLLRQKQSWISKSNTAAVNAALLLKKQRCCGKSSLGFQKATLLP